MADIELVIKIADETYDKVVKPDNWYNPNTAIRDIVNAIKESKPLPKGHGRLIDADKAISFFESKNR